MLASPFEVRAYVAGTLIAAAAGLVGYFLVLRSQVFTGDALSHVAFTGALAALVAGIDLRVGLFAACIVFGVAMAVLGRSGRADDVVIGTVFAWILGLGVLFLALYSTGTGGGNGSSGVNVLFGSIFGLSAGQTALAAVVAGLVIVAIVTIARPLLFASIDESVAAALGVPVRLLGIVFLILVGVTAGEATQAVGALLVLGLMASPAAAAQRLTVRPFLALWLSAGLAVASLWAGLGVAYAASSLPPSFAILAVSTGLYVVSLAVTGDRSQLRRSRRHPVRRGQRRRAPRPELRRAACDPLTTAGRLPVPARRWCPQRPHAATSRSA